jgi:membrane protein DedA with SNARE-associated domain
MPHSNCAHSDCAEYSDLKGRKFLLTVLSIFLITGMSVGTAFLETLQVVFPAFIGGILGILSLYFTGNIANKYVVNKIPCQQSKPKEEKEE